MPQDDPQASPATAAGHVADHAKAVVTASRRRRYLFGTRALLSWVAIWLFFVVVGLVALFWLSPDMQKARRQRRAVEAVLAAGGSVDYDYQYDAPGGRFLPDATPPAPGWLRAVVGDGYFTNVIAAGVDDSSIQYVGAFPQLNFLQAYLSHATPDRSAHLAGLPVLEFATLTGIGVDDRALGSLKGSRRLKCLYLGDTSITNAGVASIRGMDALVLLDLSSTKVGDDALENLGATVHLQWLDLGRTQIAGPGLRHLNALKELQDLNLHGTRVTDAGLAYIAGLTQLKCLNLGDTHVSDAGLPYLAGLTQLEILDLGETYVSDAGMPRLKSLTHLRQLTVPGTKTFPVPPERVKGMRELQESLPNMRVHPGWWPKGERGPGPVGRE
ncbi:MAG: hypothetical protein ABR915_24340 [Thermoguttaceae bacterium]